MELTIDEVSRLLGEKDIIIYQQAKMIENYKKQLDKFLGDE